METNEKNKNKNVVVEVQLRDGTLSMYIGEEISRNDKYIRLCKASWIASTGRRNKFFAGEFDQNVEIEPYPDNTEIDLPVEGSIFTTWNNPLPREVR